MADDKELVQELQALKQRLQLLEDKEAIRDLLVQYGFTADFNHNDDFVNLFTEDGVFDTSKSGPMKGRERIKHHMTDPGRAHQSITNRSQHLMGFNLIIHVDGDTATAAGHALTTVHWQAGFGIFRGGFRLWRFRRVEGRWRIQETIAREAGDPLSHSLISPDWYR